MPILSAKTFIVAAIAALSVCGFNVKALADAPESDLPPTSAVVLTRTAARAFEHHDLSTAVKFSREALLAPSLGRMLTDADAGLDELILAKTDVFRGFHRQALGEYELAVGHFGSSGVKMQTLLALSYAEMALLCLEAGDVHKADGYMDQAKLTEVKVQKWTPEEQAYLRDLRAHYLCSTGRLADARATLRDTLDLYENNPRLSGHSRGHMYRDFAQISFASGEKDLAVSYLNKSLDALKPDADNSRDLMLTLTMLAEYEGSEHDDKRAEESYQSAVARAYSFTGVFPRETARVLSSWGKYLAARSRWQEARQALLEAVRLTQSVQVDFAAKVQYLHLLAKIDRHVHEKREAAIAEQRAKEETVSVSLHEPSQSLTVDVLTLQGWAH